MNKVQAQRLSGGRLHLQHGPIDLVIWAEGPATAVQAGYRAARARMEHVLQELAGELPLLRRPYPQVEGRIAKRMAAACAPYRPLFLTPMAAVAGAVAEEVLAHLIQPHMTRAYVNNGGDIAIHLTEGQRLTCAVAAAGRHGVEITHGSAIRGIATSGWGGRSFSFGIADAVTVLARSASMADAAATVIANAVDLPAHPAIRRKPACDLQADSDLGARLVTTQVPDLSPAECDTAIAAGMACAYDLQSRGIIEAAAIFLQSGVAVLGAPFARIGKGEAAFA